MRGGAGLVSRPVRCPFRSEALRISRESGVSYRLIYERMRRRWPKERLLDPIKVQKQKPDDLLPLLAKGYCNQEIAEALGRSLRHIRKSVEILYRRAGIYGHCDDRRFMLWVLKQTEAKCPVS